MKFLVLSLTLLITAANTLPLRPDDVVPPTAVVSSSTSEVYDRNLDLIHSTVKNTVCKDPVQKFK